MNRKEFDKIIESNPEAKFKLVGSEGCIVFFDEGAVFTYYEETGSSKSAEFYCEAEDVYQTIWLCDVGLAESVVQPLKLRFPCCIATSEIKDEETFSKVKELLIASGAVDCGGSWRDFSHFPYYGVDEEDGESELKFWKLASSYSPTLDEDTVTVYTLKDLFPEVTEETVVEDFCDNNPWTEWNGSSEAPVPYGTKVDIKYHDGSIAIGIGSEDGSEVSGCSYSCSSWYRNTSNPVSCAVVAYRLHKDASVASQDSAQEVLAESSTLGTTIAQSDVQATTEPFKVVKHTYYDVTIKGEEYRFTKEEANLLCTLLVEAIGEDYEPI